MRLILLGLLLSGGVAASAASLDERDLERLDRQLAGRIAGEPQRCINPRLMRGSSSYAGTTILYKQNSRTLWRNDPPGGCGALRGGRSLTVRTFGSSLCEGDIATVDDYRNGAAMGSCALGKFVPYTRPDK